MTTGVSLIESMETVQDGTNCATTPTGQPTGQKAGKQGYIRGAELSLGAGQDPGLHEMECSDQGPEDHTVEDMAKQRVMAEGQWWHVNRGGFPIPEETWEKMWQHVTDTHPRGAAIEESIREKPCRRVSMFSNLMAPNPDKISCRSNDQRIGSLLGSVPTCSQLECTLWSAQCAREPDGSADVPAATTVSSFQRNISKYVYTI